MQTENWMSRAVVAVGLGLTFVFAVLALAAGLEGRARERQFLVAGLDRIAAQTDELHTSLLLQLNELQYRPEFLPGEHEDNAPAMTEQLLELVLANPGVIDAGYVPTGNQQVILSNDVVSFQQAFERDPDTFAAVQRYSGIAHSWVREHIAYVRGRHQNVLVLMMPATVFDERSGGLFVVYLSPEAIVAPLAGTSRASEYLLVLGSSNEIVIGNADPDFLRTAVLPEVLPQLSDSESTEVSITPSGRVIVSRPSGSSGWRYVAVYPETGYGWYRSMVAAAVITALVVSLAGAFWYLAARKRPLHAEAVPNTSSSSLPDRAGTEDRLFSAESLSAHPALPHQSEFFAAAASGEVDRIVPVARTLVEELSHVPYGREVAFSVASQYLSLHCLWKGKDHSLAADVIAEYGRTTDLVKMLTQIALDYPVERAGNDSFPEPMPSASGEMDPDQETDTRIVELADEHLTEIGSALRYIHEHYKDDIRLDNVAAAAGLSSHYFSTLFHERTGKTVIGYITDLRIGEAEAMLSQSDANVLSIAEAVGYSNARYFSRVFQRQTGFTPMQYRKLAAAGPSPLLKVARG